MHRLLSKKPDLYLSELATKITKHQIKHLEGPIDKLTITPSIVFRELQALNYSRKKVFIVYY